MRNARGIRQMPSNLISLVINIFGHKKLSTWLDQHRAYD